MPIEYRKLIFLERELYELVPEFCEGNGTILAQDEIVSVELTDVPNHPVVLRYTTATQSGTSEVSLSRDQLAAALISYCRQNRIPVPRSATKNLKIDGNEVSLLVHVPK